MIRYERGSGDVDVPFDQIMAGQPTHYTDPAPFTGNGFTASGLPAADGNVIPEFYAGSNTMKPGAEMWEISKDGTFRLLAALDRYANWIPTQ